MERYLGALLIIALTVFAKTFWQTPAVLGETSPSLTQTLPMNQPITTHSSFTEKLHEETEIILKKVIFEDDGHDMCTACRNPVNRRMALLFENDYDEKNLLVNECRRCGATWSSYVSDYLCTLCSKQDRISIGEKL